MGTESLRTQVPLGIRKTCMPQDSLFFSKSLSSLHRAVFNSPSLKLTEPGGKRYMKSNL